MNKSIGVKNQGLKMPQTPLRLPLIKSTTQERLQPVLRSDEAVRRHYRSVSNEVSSVLPNKGPRKRRLNTGTISRDDFKFLFPVGFGGYGKVWKAEHTKSKGDYAIKEMEKNR